MNGYMLKPLNFDPSKRYPVVMSQYSGPGSQSVLDDWKVDWGVLPGQPGFIVACVDGRGTGGRSRAYETAVYMHLGKYETEDQVAGARYMSSLPYVDGNRIGIYGWSYGGYETLMAMSTGGGHLPRRSGHRSRDRLALLRHHLRRAFHAHPAGERRRLPPIGPHHPPPPTSRAICSSSRAQPTTTYTISTRCNIRPPWSRPVSSSIRRSTPTKTIISAAATPDDCTCSRGCATSSTTS